MLALRVTGTRLQESALAWRVLAGRIVASYAKTDRWPRCCGKSLR